MNALSVLPKQAEIVEVGLRDGFQSLDKVISIETKLDIVARLIEAGVKDIQVSSFVHPERVPQMADAEALCARLPKAAGVSYSGLVLNLKGVERAEAAGLKVVDMGVAATETMSQKNAGCSVAEGLARQEKMVNRARAANMKVRAGIQVAFGCAYEGEVPQESVLELVRRSLHMGIDELSLADSTGMANPLQIEGMLRAVRSLAGETPIVLHLHDTRGMGLANVYAALRQNVSRFDTAFGGLGGCPFIAGASGNIATEDTLHMLKALDLETGIDISGIAGISRELERLLDRSLPAKLPHLKEDGPHAG